MSNYARLIQAEKVYQEKIRQLQAEVSELKKTIERLEHVLEEWDVPEILWKVVEAVKIYEPTGKVEAEIIPEEQWKMWHDPDGNPY